MSTIVVLFDFILKYGWWMYVMRLCGVGRVHSIRPSICLVPELLCSWSTATQIRYKLVFYRALLS